MDIDKLTHAAAIGIPQARFSTLLDIDKLTRALRSVRGLYGFSTLLDIDKLTHYKVTLRAYKGFSTLLDIDKLTLVSRAHIITKVLVLCWILINLHIFLPAKSSMRF